MGFLKVMHTNCYLLCHVLYSPYSVNIPVLHHDLISSVAFLRNRFWWKDNNISHGAEIKIYTAMYSLLTVHRSTVILEIYYLIKLENSLLFEHRYIWRPPSPALPQHQILSTLFLFIENKSLMCGCTVLISIQFGLSITTIDNIP